MNPDISPPHGAARTVPRPELPPSGTVGPGSTDERSGFTLHLLGVLRSIGLGGRLGWLADVIHGPFAGPQLCREPSLRAADVLLAVARDRGA
jgi:hypothetical protein